MPLLINRIGTKQFIALRGEIILPQEMLELDERPGVDGTEITFTGIKGRPFQLTSQADVEAYQYARDEVQSYLNLISMGPLEIVQGGVSSLSLGYLVKVLNFTPTRILRLGQSIGGLTEGGPGTGFIEGVWDLISIPI